MNHYVFIIGGGFRNQERERCQSDIVDHRSAVAEQPPIAVQEVDEQERADALVTVGKRMVLDDEVQQVRAFRFHARIRGLAQHGLIEIAEQRGETFFPLAAEQIARLAPPRCIRSAFSRAMAARASCTVGNTPPGLPLGSVSNPSS